MPNSHPPSLTPQPIRLTLEHRLRLAQAIAGLVRAKLPLAQALNQLSGQTTGSFAQSIEAVNQRLQEGHSLSSSLAPGADSSARMLLASIELGERSGKLDQSLDRWAEYYLVRQRTTRRFRSALFYPFMLIGVALASILFSAWKLLPQYRQAFSRLAETQPAWLHVLDAIHEYFVPIAVLIIVTVAFLIWQLLSNQRRVDEWLVPRGRAARSQFYSRIAQMSVLGVQSGKPVHDWIGLVMQSVGLKQDDPIVDMEANDTWSHRLGRETCSVLVGLDAGQLSAGEGVSLLQTIAENLATQAEVEVDRQVQRLPMLTSLVVGVTAFSAYLGLIYLPWLALYCQISQQVEASQSGLGN